MGIVHEKPNTMNILEKTQANYHQALPNMDEEERLVMLILLDAQTHGIKHTMRHIAGTRWWLQMHPQQEAQIVRNHYDTALRSVRRAVFQLRNQHHIGILAGDKGLWLPNTQQECVEWLEGEERAVRAASASLWSTFKSMQIALNLEPEFEPLDQH